MNMPKSYSKQIIENLERTYPDATIALNYTNSWELLVAVILSAQCTDIMVNKVTEKLFVKYRSLDEYVAADIEEFEKDIKSTGFYRNKAKNILATAKIIKERYNSKIPNSIEKLCLLPGVARKTANIVLSIIFGIIEGIAVDTHVNRISQRLRLVDLDAIGGKKRIYFSKSGIQKLDYIKDADSNKIEQKLMEIIPKGYWSKLTYLIIDHGRAICKAINPRCDTCILNNICPCSRK
jgi:endonuclease III